MKNKLTIKKRNRIVYGISIILVMLLGLSSRRFSNYLPKWLGLYAGDILWALMVFLGIGFIFKNWSSLKVAIAAVIFSFAVEFSQLYHSPWIDGIRRTRLLGLILGYGFLWSDLVCYMAGIIIGVIIEKVIKGCHKK